MLRPPDPFRYQNLMLRAFLYAMVIFRIWYASARELVPDEAFYWVLSRHLAGGYLDHPPMVALLIKLSSSFLPTGRELGVRFFAVVLTLGSLGVLTVLAKRFVKEPRAVMLLVAIWLCSPLFAALGTIMTPDVPAFFFSACALAVAVKAVAEKEPGDQMILRLWLLFGVFCGLALLSKYTTILLPASVVLALLCSPAGRAHLRKPGIYLAAAFALAVFWPNLDWNATHRWASFAYQLHHGMAAGSASTQPAEVNHLRNLGEYVGGQLLVWTPILFVLGVGILVHYWRRYTAIDLPRQILVWSATLPLVFFAYAALKAHGEANWPGFAYLPLSVLTVDYLATRWSSAATKWAKAGAGLALACAIIMQSPELVYKMILLAPAKLVPKKELPRKLVDVFGWKMLAFELDRWAGGAMVVCNSHEDAGEMAFYMRRQPEVWVAGINTRPTSFDYFDNKPDFNRVPAVLLVGGNTREFCAKYSFEPPAQTMHWLEILSGHRRDRSIALCIRRAATQPAP